MGCPSTVACRLSNCFVSRREVARSPRPHYKHFSFQPRSTVPWPSLSTNGVHPSTSLLASQVLLDKIGSLVKGSIDDKLKVIAELGEIGDDRVVPMLVGGLLDSSSLIASETEKALWKIFMHSGSKEVDQLLQEGLALMFLNNLLEARYIFTKVIEVAPSFAEGWNKRATVNYLLQDYQASIMDCRQTLELNPYHFGALSEALRVNNEDENEASKENPWLDT